MIKMTISHHGPGNGNPFKQFQWTKRAAKWADEVGPPGLEAMKRETPVSRPMPGGTGVPGQMRMKTRYERKTSAGSVSLNYGTGVKYARWVVGGAKPHLILPVAAKALRFYGGHGQMFIYRKRVNHPGNAPNPYPTRAIKSVQQQLEQRLSEIMREA